MVCTIYFLWNIQVLDAEISFNSEYTFWKFFESSYWTLKSVIFEELVFRGILLVLAIRFLGKYPACLLLAIIFGVYHWFSYGVLGNIIPMIHVFVITGVAGFMFAYAFAKTGSLYLPVALHLGWNLVTIIVFSEGPIGNQLLISSTENKTTTFMYFIFLLYQISVLPALTFLYLNFQKRKRNISTSSYS
jgi:membrane protease YdiL (CAAX protease family)